ncbi:MAG TPA: hypothetical protein VMZ53_18430 [Kofleriaceae bacterium]|nr:hypothetical protein [Kofleriaceae bacterium]
MRITLALPVLAICACEMEPLPGPSVPQPEPAKAQVALVPQPHRDLEQLRDVPVARTVDEPVCEPTQRRYKGIPIPPSVYPKKYTPWFDKLCTDDRDKVIDFCTKHPQDWQLICGGIGPLHIAYPPYVRARMYGQSEYPPHIVVIYRSVDAWERSLSAEQKAYIKEQCPGGEDQPSSDLCGDNTPLVISFDGAPIQFAATSSAFDTPAATTPWLALDRNGNRMIDDATELFGSASPLEDAIVRNGFTALAELDDNHDDVIDAKDAAFGRLLLWGDADRDRVGQPSELSAATSLVSISLSTTIDKRCDARDNCEGERATVVWRDSAGLHTGAVVDVYLARH